MTKFSFDDLPSAPLHVDAIYEGGPQPNKGADALARLLKAGNSGGFRFCGKVGAPAYAVLYTDGTRGEWPDYLDRRTGVFTYFGDNDKPGSGGVGAGNRKGNQFLERIFAALHAPTRARQAIPPIFAFEKHATETSRRSVRFLGLAVPGAENLSATEDLVAVWKSIDGSRFQNYKASLTILDVSEVDREWIWALERGEVSPALAPVPWVEWKQSGKVRPLTATPAARVRPMDEQIPSSTRDREMLKVLFDHFGREGTGRAFEYFAADAFGMSDPRVVVDEITRGVADGGRDAVGHYKLGLETDPVVVEFALEAKCYDPGLGGSKQNTVGVRELSRLISRIRHRQFGVLVTTSGIARQAYQEVREDGHPILFLVGSDLVHLLLARGVASTAQLTDWLAARYPLG